MNIQSVAVLGAGGSWLLCDMGTVPYSGGCGMELESIT